MDLSFTLRCCLANRLPWRLLRRPRTAALLFTIANCLLGSQVLANEIQSAVFPLEGSSLPHTYTVDILQVSCTQLDPYPPSVSLPWNPTIDEAKTYCSTRFDCGGFIYLSAAANLAGGGSNLAEATYCKPQTFVAGLSSATSAVAFTKLVYQSCDVSVPLSVSTSTGSGAATWTRATCIRPNRGLVDGRDRSPRPGRVKHKSRPKPFATISGIDFEVGKEVFIDQVSAQDASVDGSAYTIVTASGASYYMPGFTHATRAQYALPFALDGYYPLYNLSDGARAASTRGGGNGAAFTVGPSSSTMRPLRWLSEPFFATYYMPVDGATLYQGDYVAPLSIDGYFPLYRNVVDAQKASSSGLAQSHGPGSSTGHPLSWSDGQIAVYYLPEAGPTKYYGSHVVPESLPPSSADLYGTSLRTQARLDLLGDGVVAAAAAQAVLGAATLGGHGHGSGFIGVR